MKNKYHIFNPIISESVKIVGAGKIKIGPFSVIDDYVLLDSGISKSSTLVVGKRSKIKQGAILRTYDGEISIGDRVSIGEYSVIAGHGKTTIGNCTIIAGHCNISAANHIYACAEIMRFQGETAIGITIGDNVWIGTNSSILDGVYIGNGCVIGAGSVVTHDLPPNCVCCGVPCRVLREKKLNIDML